MEALAALGIAAAVVQFVDFSSRLVSKGQQLYHSADGALAENIEIEEASKRLQALTEPLQVPQGEGAVVEISKACVLVSKDLVAFLTRLKVPPGHSHKQWKSFRQALKSVSSKDKIKEMKMRLRDLRGELDTHVVLGIREQISVLSIQEDLRFKSLNTTTQNIIANLLDLRRTFREDMGNQFQHLLRSEHLEHNKTRAILRDHTKAELDFRVCQSITESLHFSTRTVRQETVPEAHMRTFEWVFRDPEPGAKPWSHFGSWLEAGEGIYWINGKAGSGKSTLMKFIVDHTDTKYKLRVWTKGTSLETPSFFFWNSGDPNQRSQEGLLRSLLYEMLLKHPELVPSVFPEIWERESQLASNNVPNTLSTWTLVKLKHAFCRLVSTNNLSICFFIDGLDEYDGDYFELAQYFSKLSRSPHVKLCLSSRPWPAFQVVFRDCASLRLQDLTREDIYYYVNDKMNNNRNLVSLRQREPSRTDKIVSSLILKAQGVFLWVALVVKSLLRGLSHRNSLAILEKRLDAMPPDLESLYSHMLSSIDKENMEEGSRIFQLFAAFPEGDADMDLVYHALRENVPDTLTSSPSAVRENLERLQHERFDSVSQEMDVFLQTRCGGLLEIHTREARAGEWESGRLFYIHRTVSDYLKFPKIWRKMLSHTSNTNWDLRKTLIISAVRCLKDVICPVNYTQTQSMESIDYVTRRWYLLARQTHRMLDKGALTDGDTLCLLDDFDIYAARIALSYRWTESQNRDNHIHWSNNIMDVRYLFPRPNFTSFAAENGLWFYVNYKLKYDPSLLGREATPLLAHTVLANFKSAEVSPQSIIKTLEVILSFSADPNQSFRGHSLWQYWLSILHTANMLHTAETPYDEALESFQKGTVAMLEAGADLNAACLKDSVAWKRLYRKHVDYIDAEGFLVTPAIHPISYLIEHAAESWKDRTDVSHQCQRERYIFAGKDSLSFRERHCLKAVIEHLFGKIHPKGADEILQLIKKLEADKASGNSSTPIVDRKRKIEEVDVD